MSDQDFDTGEVLMPGCRICAYDPGGGVRIDLVEQRGGAARWAVRHEGSVLNRYLKWEWEPMPSGRDDEFLERCRFGTPQEALAFLRLSQQDADQSNTLGSGLLQGGR
jgi:hypothetical protein